MLWLWISSLLLVNGLPHYDFSTRPDVVAAARGQSTRFGKRLAKRQQAWTGYYPSNYYSTGWPFSYLTSYYYDPYYPNDAYSTYYYPQPISPPLREDLGPNPPYVTPKSSYNPCADPNSVSWTVECNGGGSQKTTKIDGGVHSLQETSSFFTWKYGPKSPFNQPFAAVGNPSLNGQFSGDNNDDDSEDCVNGIDQNGNACTNNNDSGDGGGGGYCVNGLDSSGNSCGNDNSNNNRNGGNGSDCVDGLDSNGNACGGGNNNNNGLAAANANVGATPNISPTVSPGITVDLR
ncbi:hypothetical protein CBER1_01229 [Cercospora berteroae]|uniref:Uncharacterized protein n=1 Tax=Cercospora berteroae TaxID=357750 RepID=A0A2S6CIT3_9PEZI|nr:hypothetical protein CBER1_01229 [Cercospora berteroae]